MIDDPSGSTLTALSEKHSSWLQESSKHVTCCQLCWSISDQSTTHRLARLELLH